MFNLFFCDPRMESLLSCFCEICCTPGNNGCCQTAPPICICCEPICNGCIRSRDLTYSKGQNGQSPLYDDPYDLKSQLGLDSCTNKYYYVRDAPSEAELKQLYSIAAVQCTNCLTIKPSAKLLFTKLDDNKSAVVVNQQSSQSPKGPEGLQSPDGPQGSTRSTRSTRSTAMKIQVQVLLRI